MLWLFTWWSCTCCRVRFKCTSRNIQCCVKNVLLIKFGGFYLLSDMSFISCGVHCFVFYWLPANVSFDMNWNLQTWFVLNHVYEQLWYLQKLMSQGEVFPVVETDGWSEIYLNLWSCPYHSEWVLVGWMVMWQKMLGRKVFIKIWC